MTRIYRHAEIHGWQGIETNRKKKDTKPWFASASIYAHTTIDL